MLTAVLPLGLQYYTAFNLAFLRGDSVFMVGLPLRDNAVGEVGGGLIQRAGFGGNPTI